MRLAISNIAWDVAEDAIVAQLLQDYGIDAIDIAPSKYFPAVGQSTDLDIARVKDWWAQRGIEITGMQSLLFGTTGLNVFGDQQTQSALLQHLTDVCRVAGRLGATRLVFGSPKNRDRSGLTDQQALEAATLFFGQLGDIALANGVFICLEPNPTCYGANFMTTSAETAKVVRHTAHPAIRMQLDTGALAINGENPLTMLEDCSSLIGHIHASEPNLVPLGDGPTNHTSMSAAVRHYLPEHVVSVEMVATAGEPHAVSIERALVKAIAHYRGQA
ncbi:sugar phosphate isomerase/epimerase family protein [Pseudomonas sp. NPDC087615]|uniref:sugar phosphate isomerase/epimerase family protein n=1 Tax=Pseudomonas sp. NPDC087615 TaxID=3364443 RepID=UPI00380B20F2